jgi:hypothetical protein
MVHWNNIKPVSREPLRTDRSAAPCLLPPLAVTAACRRRNPLSDLAINSADQPGKHRRNYSEQPLAQNNPSGLPVGENLCRRCNLYLLTVTVAIDSQRSVMGVVG